jgi:chromosome segregation ATPase
MAKVPKNYFRIILTVLLMSITLFSIFKYLSSLKEKYDLLDALNQIKEQVAALQTERQNLLRDLDKEKKLQQQVSQENAGLKDSLRASEEKLAKLDADFTQARKGIAELNSQISALKAENAALRDQGEKLKLELSQFSQEKDALEARLNSIAELKKAIRKLKKQMRKVSIEIKQKTQGHERIVGGNRGYLIKDGQTIYPAKVKIEVIPAPAKE